MLTSHVLWDGEGHNLVLASSLTLQYAIRQQSVFIACSDVQVARLRYALARYLAWGLDVFQMEKGNEQSLFDTSVGKQMFQALGWTVCCGVQVARLRCAPARYLVREAKRLQKQ